MAAASPQHASFASPPRGYDVPVCVGQTVLYKPYLNSPRDEWCAAVVTRTSRTGAIVDLACWPPGARLAVTFTSIRHEKDPGILKLVENSGCWDYTDDHPGPR